MTLIPRKLLAAALPLTLAAACGHASTAAAPARAVAIRAPVVAPAAMPVAASAAVVTPVAAVAAVEATPRAVASPMCDSDGRPLAGNTARKNARVCSAVVAENP